MKAVTLWRPQLDNVYCYPAETFLNALESDSIDLAVTSPPYNLRNTTGGGFPRNNGMWKGVKIRDGYDTYEDNMPHDEYVRWQRGILDECMRVIKPNGAIFYNHKWRVQAGLLQDRSDILMGLPVRQIIIWKRDTLVNFNDSYFVPTYEVIYLIAKPDFKLASGKNMFTDVWNIPAERDNPHPAPFPIQLAERCIISTNAQVILDPFMGSGTTALAARNLKRHYIGCDISPHYVEMANKRLALPFTPMLFDMAAGE